MSCTEELIKLIKDSSGIYVTGAHLSYLKKYILNRKELLNLNDLEFIDYLKNDKNEFQNLINEAAINETYFFREEKHFDFLNEFYFPNYKKEVCKIWSGACSSGEEVLSIVTLAEKYNINYEFLATDIDNFALEKFLNGVYENKSLRTDGSKFHNLLSRYIVKKSDNKIHIDKKILEKINIEFYNLYSFNENFNKTFDLIFLRNVLIYFDDKTKTEVLKFVASKLNDGGVLLFSINEVPNLNMEKDLFLEINKYKDVFYYQKKIKNTKNNNDCIELKEVSSVNINDENFICKDFDKTDLYKKFLCLLNESDYSKINDLLNEKNFSINNKFLFYYLTGVLNQFQNKIDESILNFEKSIMFASDLWPAYIKIAVLKLNINKKYSIEYFKKASELLKSYIANKKSNYNFLLDDFNPKYFYDLSLSYLEKGEQNAI